MPRTAVPAASWLTDTQEQPRADALSGSRIRRRARFYRVYLLSAAVLCPLLLLALAAAVSGSPSTTPRRRRNRTRPAGRPRPRRCWTGCPRRTRGWLDGRLLQWSGARSVETPATENAAPQVMPRCRWRSTRSWSWTAPGTGSRPRSRWQWTSRTGPGCCPGRR